MGKGHAKPRFDGDYERIIRKFAMCSLRKSREFLTKGILPHHP
jgi:hypothetical protein